MDDSTGLHLTPLAIGTPPVTAILCIPLIITQMHLCTY